MTVFSKIIQNPDKNSFQILELNEDFLIMLTLNPVTKGHALIIPVQETDDLNSLEKSSEFLEITLKWAEIITEKLGAPAYTLKINNKVYLIEEGGHVNHLHFHIIPRYGADEMTNDLPPKASEQELDKIRKIITGH